MKFLVNTGVIVCGVFFLILTASSFGQPIERDSSEFFYPRGMTPPIKPAYRRLDRITFGKDIFVAIGPNETLLSSKDGSNWTNHSSDIGGTYVNINFATKTYSYAGDIITIVFPDISTNKASSTESTNLNAKSEPSIKAENAAATFGINPIPHGLWNIAFGNGTFVVVGEGGLILSSEDGEHWQYRASGTPAALTSVVWGDSGFIAVGDRGVILSSDNGIFWTRQTSGTEQRLYNVAFGNRVYVVTAEGTSPLISSNGVFWKQTEGPLGSGIAFGNGCFVVSGITMNISGSTYIQNHEAMASRDGETWQHIQHPTQNQSEAQRVRTYNHDGDVNSITFCGGQFIACTDVGIYTSTNGNNWQPTSEPDGCKSDYRGVAYGKGVFVAVGTGDAVGTDHSQPVHWSTVATSKDASKWEVDSTETPQSNLLVADALGTNVVRVPRHGRQILLHTSDGINWRTRDKAEISGTVYGRTLVFYYLGEPAVFSSDDGVTWRALAASKTDQPTQIVDSLKTQAAVTQENNVLMNLNGKLFKLNLTAKAGQSLEIQASTNLIDWVSLGQVSYTNGPIFFYAPDVSTFPSRFFRLKAP
jgi:hypothetical protein